ncbi:hypothetical protein WJX72_004476 [[Myrmecia] bisecta]|uniref:Uncharacterized protein n=1 Tax=[Myrmecia] bisecta TaxID=41462 RepID=A0AAW1PBM1_9CHLO
MASYGSSPVSCSANGLSAEQDTDSSKALPGPVFDIKELPSKPAAMEGGGKEAACGHIPSLRALKRSRAGVWDSPTDSPVCGHSPGQAKADSRAVRALESALERVVMLNV